jgi:hypothetical protein
MKRDRGAGRPMQRSTHALAAALIGATLVAGCGSSHHSAATGAASQGQTSAVGATGAQATATSAHPGALHGASSPVRRGTTPAKPAPPTIPVGPLLRSFSGSGNGTLGSLSEKTPVVLTWKTAAPPLQLFTSKGFMLIDSTSRRGAVRLARGRYKKLRVASRNQWTIEIHAER